MLSQENNHWLDEACARAFGINGRPCPTRSCCRTPALARAGSGQTWLDLGCGCGELTRLLWQLSQGQLAEIVALDCNPVNAEALARLQRKLQPSPRPAQIRFLAGSFSDGLPQLADASFDGIVSGLAISYAEWRDPVSGNTPTRLTIACWPSFAVSSGPGAGWCSP